MQFLAQLDLSARRSASASVSVSRHARLDAIQEADEDDEEDDRIAKEEEARRLEQAYLNSKCARLVLSCVRHR